LGFVIFLVIFGCKRVICDEMDGDRPRSPANRNCYRLSHVSRAYSSDFLFTKFWAENARFLKICYFLSYGLGPASCNIYFCKVPISYTDFMAVIVVFYFGFVFFMLKQIF